MKYGDATMGQFEAVINKLGGMDGLRRFLANEVVIKVSAVLKRVFTVSVRATNRFIASDHLKSANIGWMNDDFKSIFLNKVEKDVPATELVISKLVKASLDGSITAELGERKKIFLAHFFELLERQSVGQSGLLLDGNIVIGYIQDEEGNFWAVCACWRSDDRYWSFEAFSVDGSFGWNAGRQVLSGK